MLILFWAAMLIWLIVEGVETARSKSVSSSLAAWIAVAILAGLTVGLPK